jgi:ABC-2 type transport system permease protein
MALRALVGRSLARIAGFLTGIGVLLIALQFAIVFVAALQEERQSFELLAKLAPAFVQRQFGASFTFAGLATFGYFHPVVLLLMTLFTAFVATELAADVENGHVDLLLARSIPRHALVTRSFLVVIAVPLLIVSIMVLSTVLGLRAFAPGTARWPSVGILMWLAAHLVALSWCFGAVALAVAAHARRRTAAFAPVAIAAVTLYLVDLLSPAWRLLEPLATISPFHYYQGPAILAGTANGPQEITILVVFTLIAAGVAYWRFSARDV